uniref:ATP-dependent DNA helicase n=1 Tax=Lactuca sativa TaxID=4236 RepID=A0A9R1VHI7_LACSA|nr:hypothetical protein LSAT_V11C500293940 [Lactuca sativa]
MSDINATDARKKRKNRKLYLDNRKSKKQHTISSYLRTPTAHVIHCVQSGTNNTTQSIIAKERRKIRKLYLDNRKSKILPTISTHQNSSITHASYMWNNDVYTHGRKLISTDNYTNVSLHKENINPVKSIVYQHTIINPHSTNINVTTPFSTISNGINYIFNNNVQTPVSSNINATTPFSNISNGSYILNNNLQTPLSINKENYVFGNATTSGNCSSINQNSSSIKLPRGKHQLKRKTSSISAIPMFDLTLDEENIDDHIIEDIFRDYLDHGDQIVICQICHAKLWKAESIRGQKKKAIHLIPFVALPSLKEASSLYRNMYRSVDSKSKHSMKNIRCYNSMFSFTSMGAKVDSSINKGNAPYIFRLSGQNYHSMGSLLPTPGSSPKFRHRPTSTSTSTSTAYDVQIIEFLKDMLDSNNALVKSYRMVRDTLHENPCANLKLRLIGKKEQDGRTYNLPSSSEVAALVVGDICDSIEKRDIVVQTSSGLLQRISELHPSYLALQYPLLFSYGDDGYRVDILHRGISSSTNSKRSTCTMREFFAYRIQDRDQSFSLILNAKRLFQQFLVDGYTMIESERLFFIRNQQKILRCESYEKLRNQQALGITDISNVGQRVILPSSFTSGAHYMMQNYLDAMFLKDTPLHLEDRPDILCRLFKIKLDAFIKDVRENEVFGKVQAVVYTIEFQKRCLPHSHICLFMHADCKVPTVEYIDPIISVEIPNINDDPELYSLVKEFMIHGPCGAENLNCPCMVDRKCSKNFPKLFCNHTSVDSNGFPLYRRRDDGHFVEKSGVQLDNRNVVPYNKYLLKRYQAHINVEWCNQGSSIKYLFKYINKGPDRATVSMERTNNDSDNNDIFQFDVHYRHPTVIRLTFHLPDQQQVVYEADDDIEDVLDRTSNASSMFTFWMKCNEINKEARKLTYIEFPTKFVWKRKGLFWKPRKVGYAIGRIHSVSPKLGEAYFLRILLNKVKGPKSFDEIRTVNGQLCSSFKDACYNLGLLDDDKEFIDAIKEASLSGSGFYLRFLFATMLLSNSLCNPEIVWQNTWEYLSDGILYYQQQRLKSPGLSLNEDQIKNLTLFEIEQILLRNNSSLKDYGKMPYPDVESVSSSNNRLITEELDYDIPTLKNEFDRLFVKLTNEQRDIFLDIMDAVKHNKGGVFFVYGYGGTGKTFLWKTISTTIRAQGQIVLNVASSGITSLLLTGGRTTHSRFRIPINLTEDSYCRINPKSDLASLVRKTSLIIWDEAPMVHKHAFEVLDRTLKDILKCVNPTNSNIPFGGKVIVFGGDFRQILPVVPGGSRQNIVNASLSSSYLWQQCKVHKLTKNMRLTVGSDPSAIEKIRDFADWLLDIGEGNLGGPNDGEAIVDIPRDIVITNPHDPISSLISFVYPSLLDNFNIADYFQERAILAPKNEVVQEINDRLLSLFPVEKKKNT